MEIRLLSIVVFAGRLSKMDHFAAVTDSIDGEGTATLFIDRVFRQHGLSLTIISDRDTLYWTVLEVRLQGARQTIGHVHSGSSADR